ncbi:MAG TPA: hypothetical protein VGV87_12030 [Blastocatellia bacterium]|jgi:hypothetical protein|nr:hypothetical protein [Blastocatellia bacterium]
MVGGKVRPGAAMAAPGRMQVAMKALAPQFVILLLLNGLPGVTGIEISVKNGSERENQTKAQLERLLKQYNLAKWIFTTKVIIDQAEIPHSHPVLTLHTRHLGNDDALLSTFIHEQIHWFEEQHAAERDKAIKELEAIYPEAPGGPPEGARDKNSTYLHLMVCYLEYLGMIELVGPEKARHVIEESSHNYYKWIYATVLKDGPKIAAVLEKHKLKL